MTTTDEARAEAQRRWPLPEFTPWEELLFSQRDVDSASSQAFTAGSEWMASRKVEAAPSDTETCAACQGTRGYWTERWNDCPACEGTGRTSQPVQVEGALSDERVADLWDFDITQQWVRVKLANRIREAGLIVVPAPPEPTALGGGLMRCEHDWIDGGCGATAPHGTPGWVQHTGPKGNTYWLCPESVAELKEIGLTVSEQLTERECSAERFCDRCTAALGGGGHE